MYYGLSFEGVIMAKKSKGEHYVNNKEFLKAMVEWRERCVTAEDAGKPRPPITNYIGECFLKLLHTYHIDPILLIIHTGMK